MANRGKILDKLETDEEGNPIGGVVGRVRIKKEEKNIPVRGATVVVPVKKIEENLMSRRNNGGIKPTPDGFKDLAAQQANAAAPIQTPVATVVASDLPDLDAIVVKTMTDEEKKAADAKIRARKQWAETAGKKLAVINREIAEIEKVPAEELELDPDRQKTLVNLKAARETLVNAGDEGLQKHLAFSTLMAEIKSATPDKAEKYVGVGITLGRIRFTEKTIGPANLILWDKTVEPVPDATGKVSLATIAFTNELRKLCNAAKASDRKKAIDALKASATLTVGQLPHTGTAYGHLPARDVKLENGGVKHENESHFTVTCGSEKMRPAQAEGRLNGFWKELSEAGTYLTPKEFREGKLLRHIDSTDEFKKTVAFLKIIRAAAFLERKEETREGEAA